MTVSIDARTLASSLRRLGADSESASEPDQAVLVRSLQRVIDACERLFSIDGCGLMLADEHNVLRYVVATDGSGRRLETAQIESGEGPCVETFVRNETVTCGDVTRDPRWPKLSQRLDGAGISAVLGVPVRLSGIPVGSLDVYRSRPSTWDESEREALLRYGAVVEAMLATALAAQQAGELAAQLEYALDYRVPIERGVGYLMARDGLTHLEAFSRLRTAARNSRRKIGEVAEALLSTGRLPGEES
jgi:GAF domain-containing protein